MKVRLLAWGSALAMILNVLVAQAKPSVTPGCFDEDTSYVRVITARAGKIVAALDLSDSSLFYTVRDIVSGQYYALNAVYTERDEKLKQLKSQSDKNIADSIKKTIQQQVDEKIVHLHAAYLGRLATVISPEQIDKIKDGMTYSVLEVTFRAYLQLLPQLTDEQKGVILQDLIEARELAMDAESSEKKHAVFGKYKGRINNYLASQGISQKKAGSK